MRTDDNDDNDDNEDDEDDFQRERDEASVPATARPTECMNERMKETHRGPARQTPRPSFQSWSDCEHVRARRHDEIPRPETSIHTGTQRTIDRERKNTERQKASRDTRPSPPLSSPRTITAAAAEFHSTPCINSWRDKTNHASTAMPTEEIAKATEGTQCARGGIERTTQKRNGRTNLGRPDKAESARPSAMTETLDGFTSRDYVGDCQSQ